MPFRASFCCDTWYTNRTSFYNHRKEVHKPTGEYIPNEQIQYSVEEYPSALPSPKDTNDSVHIDSVPTDGIISMQREAEDLNGELITFCLRMLHQCHVNEECLLEVVEFLKKTVKSILSCFSSSRQVEYLMDLLFANCSSKYFIKKTLNVILKFNNYEHDDLKIIQ